MKTNRIKAMEPAGEGPAANKSNNKLAKVPCVWAEEPQWSVPIASRKNQAFATGLAMIVVCLMVLLLLAGCKDEPHFTTILDAGDAIGVDSVVMMDAAPVGRVVEVAGSPRQAKILITEPSALLKMRQGVVRVKEPRQLLLVTSYVKPEASTLPVGSEIPTQSKAEFVARYGLQEYGAAALGVLGVLAVLVILILVFRRGCGCVVLLASAIFSAGVVSSVAGHIRQPGYSRDYLRSEQKRLEDHLSQAQAEADRARTRRGAGLNEMGERNLLAAQIALDGFKVEAAGHEDRVRALRANPLAYHRENQIKILLDNFNEMRGRQERLLEEINRMRQVPGKTTNVQPQPVKTLVPVTNTVVVVVTNMLERPVTNIVVVTNTERTVVEKQITTPAPPPVTNRVIEYVTNVQRMMVEKPVTNTVVIVRTNRVVVTNQERVFVDRIMANAMVGAKAANTNGNQAAANSVINEWSPPGKTAAGKTAKATLPRGRPVGSIVATVAGGLVLVVVLGWMSYTSWMRGRPYHLKLETAAGKAEDFEIGAMDEAVVLGTPPVCEAQNYVNGSPCIVAGWLGARLRAGNGATVLLNDTQVKGSKRLRPGDRIVVTKGTDQPQNYQFLDCAPMVPDAIEA